MHKVHAHKDVTMNKEYFRLIDRSSYGSTESCDEERVTAPEKLSFKLKGLQRCVAHLRNLRIIYQLIIEEDYGAT